MINYDFKPRDAFYFADKLGMQTKTVGKELRFLYCPNCRGGENKDRYTFGINLETGACGCLRSSCGYKGNMITLSKDFDIQINEDITRYFNVANFNGRFKTFKDAHRISESQDRAVEYLKERGIPEEITRKYEITIKHDTDNVLVFPFKDADGELRFIKYRNLDYVKGETKGSKEWCEANCMPILFGMNHCDPSKERLIITEGQIDSLSVAAAGIPNAVSVPTGMNGFTWIPHCWNWLNQFKEIVVFGDMENEQITLLKDLKRRTQLRILCVRPEDYMGCKDANEILQKHGVAQVINCITNAKAEPLEQTIELSKVEDKDIYEMPKVRTGIYQLDKLLCGGLPFGGVVIITGKPGCGKSTLASQLLVSAVEQGFNVFAYSGELPNYVFKKWIDYQIAGRDHVRVYKNDQFDINHYFISKDVQAKIQQWYDGKFYLYDNDITESSIDDSEDLIELIERNVKQNNVKVVLIDNLMTGLDLSKVQGFDRNDQQSKFMKRLTRLSLKHELCVLLVAHKRKNNFTKDALDEISGSGDIGNLGMITLSYDRPDKRDEEDENQRILRVAKNRLFGTVNNKGWQMQYDPQCKRVYITESEHDHDYGWNTDNDGFVSADIPDEIPF